ncbi:hypothetical protein DJ533_12705 [Acinetobacter defluvii]|uniref:Uncharacterized protein n=1 Tax=Acinetobacter defluvii TaxID=1871111 RepID=A0A2S2FEJ4_9GAMM|nr:hypothetical protein [Acinetobacter defluvii]AWL29369.1 hypothetical protein DJ533_12705 [Acinetobacter defluvii]
MKKSITLLFLMLFSFQAFADRYGVYDDDYVSSGNDFLSAIILTIVLGIVIFLISIKIIVRILNLLQLLIIKHDHYQNRKLLKLEIKNNIKKLIKDEVRERTSHRPKTKFCYILSMSLIFPLFFILKFFSENIFLGFILTAFYSFLVGVIIHLIYFSFLHIKAYSCAYKKYKQFNKLPNDIEKLTLIKKIIDSFL